MTKEQEQIIVSVYKHKGICTFIRQFDIDESATKFHEAVNRYCSKICPVGIESNEENFSCVMGDAFKISKKLIEKIPKENLLELLMEDYNEISR